ncbi:MAG TPA: hypothetical protein VK922_00475 [Gemmatimonadaceae bacterium]|nr:hypothetical protein [Gemmatimonadaceae bacterium]
MTVTTLVSRERARMTAALAAQGAGIALALAALVLAGGALVLGDARWIALPAVPLLTWLMVLLLIGAASWWTGRRLRRRASREAVAAAIEGERDLRAGALRGALEVSESGALGRRAADALARSLGTTRGALAPRTQRSLWMRGAYAAAAALLGVLALGAARTASPDGWRAMRHPVGAYTGTLLEPITMVDAPPAVLRGERVRLTILAPHRRSITLTSRATGRPWHSDALPVTDGVATVQLGPVDADLMLVADDGRVRSDTVHIRVTDRPFVGDVAVRAQYPAYLGRAPDVLPVGEVARIPRGTVLSVRGRASVALTGVALVRGDDTVRLTPDEHAFSGRLASPASGRWSWIAEGVRGPIADVPAPLELEVVADSSPVAEILAPQRDTVVLAGDRVILRAAASDDHGVASVVVRTWRVPEGGRAQPSVTQAIAEPGDVQWIGDLPIELAPRGLEPGDALHVVVEATDASPWRQTGTSRELVLRIPSLRERREMARALADSAVARAQDAARDQKELERRTGEAARSRTDRAAAAEQARTPEQRAEAEMSFENAERNRALAREQQELRDRVEQLQRDARALQEQLRAANALDSALSRQLQEVQRQLSEALTPEMQKQLERLQQATKDLSSQEARKSLQELQEEQQRLREQLERTAEMLKRAALEGAMETLHDDAEELAQRERALADSMARGEEQQSESSERMAREAEQLQERIEEIAERLKKEQAEAGPSKLEKAARNAEQSAEAMERAAQRGGEQQRQAGGQQQRQAGQQQRADAAREGAERMEQAAQQLAEARQQQVEEWKEELTSELDRSIQELVQLSREQTSLAEQARQGAQAEQMRAQQSAVQQGTEKIGERLQQEAGKSAHVSPQSQGAMGEARRKVQAATEQVAQSARASGAAESMEEAARALNQAAASLVRDRERAANAQSASGMQEMLQRMQELAQQQGQLNAQTSSILPMPGSQASEQARMLAARQRQLARQLEQAGEGDESGRADQLAREMRQIAEALQQGRLDASVVDRQQRLFQRLLDAGLSLQKEEREEQGERESTTASGTERFTPTGEARGREATRFREPDWSELRGLTAEERRAVLEYFKRLNAERP